MLKRFCSHCFGVVNHVLPRQEGCGITADIRPLNSSFPSANICVCLFPFQFLGCAFGSDLSLCVGAHEPSALAVRPEPAWALIRFQSSPVCSSPSLLTLLVSWPLLFAPALKPFASPRLRSICMDGEFKVPCLPTAPPLPPKQWHVIASDCLFLLI